MNKSKLLGLNNMRKPHYTNTTNPIDFPHLAWPFPTPTHDMIQYNTVHDDMEALDIRICHGYNRHDNRGGVTIAYRKCSNWRNTRMVEVSLAYCSPKDSFNKKIGVQLAVDRFVNGNTVMVPVRYGHDDTIVGNLLAMFYHDIIA
jgi:hypothetical protein